MKPKLFRMEEQIAICPCRDRFGVSDITHIDTCDQKQNAYQNQKFTKSGDAPAEISLYDDKWDTMIETLKDEGRYRKFINIERHKGSFPAATRREEKQK